MNFPSVREDVFLLFCFFFFLPRARCIQIHVTCLSVGAGKGGFSRLFVCLFSPVVEVKCMCQSHVMICRGVDIIACGEKYVW